MADHILCPSNNTKDDLIKIYNVDKMKISVTYFGAENLQKYISKENQSQKIRNPISFMWGLGLDIKIL